MSAFFHVEFDFEDPRPRANTRDFRDELMEKFQKAVDQGRMTNVTVKLDHPKMLEDSSGMPSVEVMADQLLAAGWVRKTRNIWKSPQGVLYLGPFGAWKVHTGYGESPEFTERIVTERP